MICVAHPGLIGDALWSIPAARALAALHGCKVVFWTSTLVAPAADLIAAQDFIADVVIDRSYQMERGDCGAQPWNMTAANQQATERGFREVYQLGFRETPTVPLPEYICGLAGLGQQPNHLDLPALVPDVLPIFRDGKLRFGDTKALCLAPKGNTSFRETFRNFARRSPVPVCEVGAPGEAVATDLGALDLTSCGFIRMAHIISRCKYFVGLLSAPYVVASGFPVIKILPHNAHWDMRHVVRTSQHHYVQSYDAADLLNLLDEPW